MEPSLELRVIGLFVILLSSILGVITPTIVKFLGGAAASRASSEPANEAPQKPGLNYKHLIKLLSAIGCGCIIATALCHIAPPAIDNLQQAFGGEDSHHDEHEGESHSGSHGHEEEEAGGHKSAHDHGFPYALAIATGAMIFLYILENELSNLVTRFQHSHSTNTEVPTKKIEDESNDGTMVAVAIDHHHHDHNDHAHAVEVSEHDKALATRNAIITHVLEIGVAVHSVLVGLALGLISEEEEARSLLIALCFHQFCEGCAVGASILDSGLGKCHSAVLWAIFSLTTPLGIAIGIAVEQGHGHSDDRDLLISQGVLESIALGVLLYMVVDMLPNLFNLDGCGGHSHHHHHHHDEVAAEGTAKPHHVQESGSMDVPCWYRLVMYSCLLLGAGIMVLIANWA